MIGDRCVVITTLKACVGDLLYGDACEPLLGEQFRRRIEDRLTAVGAAAYLTNQW